MKLKLILVILIITTSDSYSQILTDCSNCSTQIIKKENIINLSIEEIRFLTNEIYARNGYQFENSRFKDYFEEKSWYKSKNDNNSIALNEIEKKNIQLFQEITKELKNSQAELINQLKLFKSLILNNKKEELKSIFSFQFDNQTGEDEIKSLKAVLNKIELDDINYYKNSGLNSVMVDNGFVKIVYELAINGNEVNFYFNYMAHSKIINDFDQFTDYHSENEYMYNWQFIFKSNKLNFIRLAIAG